MDVFSKDALSELVNHSAEPAVSLYMPTFRQPPETRQNPIRFKNLLRQAGEHLDGLDPEGFDPERLLEPAVRLLDDDEFWVRQGDGLALFLSPKLYRAYRLPIAFGELAAAGRGFHLKPLIDFLSTDGRFYVLGLSQNQVRLLQCTRQGSDPVDGEGLPGSLEEALRFDEPLRQVQFHTGAQAGGGDRPAMFHGQGVGTDDAKDRIRRYFQEVDKGVRRLLAGENAPLILAGVDYLFSLYRERNGYPYLLEEGVEGNPEAVSDPDLRERAWPIAEAHFARRREEALARYADLAGTGKASAEIREVLPEAFNGRVDTLFLARGVRRWGRFDPGSRTAELHPERSAGDEDLLNLAAVQTLTQGGGVYLLEAERIPGARDAAAIYRY